MQIVKSYLDISGFALDLIYLFISKAMIKVYLKKQNGAWETLALQSDFRPNREKVIKENKKKVKVHTVAERCSMGYHEKI